MITTQSTYTNYQLSAVGVGAIATGLENIRQCIDFILRTIPGSDPLRPLFGSNVYRYLDSPVNVAIPNMKKEIFEALDIWEKRILITSITHELIDGIINFRILYKTTDGTEDSFIWAGTGGVVGSGETGSGIIITAVFPTKIADGVYKISFTTDDVAANPAIPRYGFASAVELHAWVSANWFSYGVWYLAGDRLVLYLAPGIAKRASIIITQTAALTLKASIPQLSIGEFYNVVFTANGLAAVPAFPTNVINNLEALLNWLGANWGGYGNWNVESNGIIISPGEFSEEFSDDFDLGGVISQRFLVLQTDLFNTATLTL